MSPNPPTPELSSSESTRARSPSKSASISTRVRSPSKLPFTLSEPLPTYLPEGHPDYTAQMTRRFPAMLNGYPHGSQRMGLENLNRLRSSPLPVAMQVLASKLKAAYHELADIEDTIYKSRRSLANSDEVDGVNSDKHRKTRNDLQRQVLYWEYNLDDLDRARKQVEHVDLKLVTALDECAKFKFHAHIGDYLAILYQEIKQTPSLFDFSFKQWRYVSELVTQVDQELGLSDDDEKINTPVLDALNKAASFLGSPFDDVNEVIEILRMYANRNFQVHNGAKHYVDDGNFMALHEILVADKTKLDQHGFTSEQKERFLRVLDLTSQCFYSYFSWTKNGKHSLNIRGQHLFKEKTPDLPAEKPVEISAKMEKERRKARKSHEEKLKNLLQDIETHTITSSFPATVEALNELRSNTETLDEDISRIVSKVQTSESLTEALLLKVSESEKREKELQKQIESLTSSLAKVKFDLAFEQRKVNELQNKMVKVGGPETLLEGFSVINDEFGAAFGNDIE